MFEITSADHEKLKEIASDSGVAIIEDTLNVTAGVLYMDVIGTKENGQAFLLALNDAGINQFIDEDGSTQENSCIFANGATQGRIWIDIVDDAPLFRDGETIRI